MNVKRYFAKTAREALRMLKDELGPDAVVLSNRAANGGVEILALPAGDVASLQRARSQAQAQAQAAAVAAAAPKPPMPAPAPRPAPAADFFDDDFRVSLSRAATQRAPVPPAPQPAPRPAPARAPEMQPFNPPRVELSREVFNAASAQVRRPPVEPAAPPAARSPLRSEAPRQPEAPQRQRPPASKRRPASAPSNRPTPTWPANWRPSAG